MERISEYQRLTPKVPRPAHPRPRPKLRKPTRFLTFLAIAAFIPILLSLAIYTIRPNETSGPLAVAPQPYGEGYIDVREARRASESPTSDPVERSPAKLAAAADPNAPKWRLVGHKVQEGDTLSQLAESYGTDVDSILAVNDLSASEVLTVGREIRILTGVGLVHEVSSGDNLSYLAKTYGVEEKQIIEANLLTNPDSLVIGQELVIPGGRRQVRDRVQVASVSRGAPNRSGIARGLSGFIWPVSGEVTSGFGWRWGQAHRGIDIAAGYGTPVGASRSGTVIFIGWNGGYGMTVIVDHGGGITSLYAHLSKILASHGPKIGPGEAVGLVGSTGISTGPHLHFEISVDGDRIDPIPVLP